jgi:CRP/FNR family cyclic AMP-dependent transcriptional regulator
MESLLDLVASHPTRDLSPGEILIAQGQPGGDLFVLESGQLKVERDGVVIATISTPGALVGEMSLILGRPSSATVRSSRETTVRAIHDAKTHLEQDQALTFRLAWLMASRLDATSAFLVDLSKQHSGKAEQNLLSKILSALHLPADEAHYATVNRNDMFGSDDPDPVARD